MSNAKYLVLMKEENSGKVLIPVDNVRYMEEFPEEKGTHIVFMDDDAVKVDESITQIAAMLVFE